MTKRPRKIDSVMGSPKKRAVLRVPKKVKFVSMDDVILQPKILPAPSAPLLSFSPSAPSNKPLRQWRYHYRPQSLRQPLIESFIVKKKLKFLPYGVNMLKLSALAMLSIIVGVPAMSAFEAHIVNVTAEVANIDPVVLTPPGNSVAWDDTNGGTGLTGTVKVGMSDADADAVNIYYTFATGTLDSSLVPNPICGQTGPNGGGGDKNLPQSLSINNNSVIKAIACESTNSFHSVINTKIYSFGVQVQGLLINEFLPNPTGNAAGNQGVANGHPGNGGEWVELFNNGTSTIDTDGFVLYDNFVPTTTPASNTWTTTGDFNNSPAPVETNTTVTSGSVLLTASSTSGTFEKVFDVGINKKSAWGNLSLSTNTLNNDPANTVCAAAATSDNGVTFTPYTNLLPCATQATTSVTTSLAALPNSRFIKWKTTHTRTNTATNANLNSLTINYNFVDFNTYHELVITTANTVNSTTPGSTIILPGDFLVVYRDGASFELDPPAQAVNPPFLNVSLYDGHVYEGANLIDSHAYPYGGSIPQNKSTARVPDGSSNWVDPCPTPGMPNVNTECPVKVLPVDNSSTSTATSTLDVLPPVGDSSNATSTGATSTIVSDISLSNSANATTTVTSDATSTPDSEATTTPITGGGGAPPNNSAQGSQGSSTPADIIPTPSPTPASDATSTQGSSGGTASTTTPSVTPIPTPTPTPVPSPTPTPTPTPGNSNSSNDSGKQQDVIAPPQAPQDQAVVPAPITGGGGTPPPPDPGAGPGVSSTTTAQ